MSNLKFDSNSILALKKDIYKMTMTLNHIFKEITQSISLSYLSYPHIRIEMKLRRLANLRKMQ